MCEKDYRRKGLGKMRGKKCQIVMLVFIVMFSGLVFAGCGKLKTDDLKSPNIKNVSVSSYNENAESKQYVQVNLTFDQEIKVSGKQSESLRITIAGERMKDYELTLGEDAKTAVLTIPVTAITKGVLEIEKSEKADNIYDICDVSGKYAVQDFTIKGIIPSGITLSTISSDKGSVVKNVDSSWNIRSIGWVGLFKDGELQPIAETNQSEILDGYIAVHGHEFLIENEKDVAGKIAETLQRVYPEGYKFQSEGTTVTAQCTDGSGGNLEIKMYQYLTLNGKSISLKEETQNVKQEDVSADNVAKHAGADVRKISEKDRTVTEEDQAFLNCLHTSVASNQAITDGDDLFHALTVTGTAMSEEEIYSVKDLEDLLTLSFENQKMYDLSLPMKKEAVIDGKSHIYYGIDAEKFLELCGVDWSKRDLYLTCTDRSGKVTRTIPASQMVEEQGTLLLAMGTEEGPLSAESVPVTGPLAILLIDQDDQVQTVGTLSRITIGEKEKDPYYRFHNREPYAKDQDKTFTIEVYQKGLEYRGAAKSYTVTAAEFEQLMKDHPEQVVKNYYGTIGSEENFEYIGVGGWLDYFEGLSLYWLVTQQVGVDHLKGSAEFVGRDGNVYATIEDLDYLSADNKKEDYYILTTDGKRISGTLPMIACTKNGYPMLPEHDHESAGYIAYNALNQALEKKGIETETGVVKNHNGPFVACLGNYNGYYGGEKIETGGDCILLRLYLEED